MKVKILSKIEEKNGGICYFCEGKLSDYLDSLKEKYDDYTWTVLDMVYSFEII